MITLGGNALLRRGEALSADNQRRNIEVAAHALARLAAKHDLVLSHGNGPQVGLLALQNEAYARENPLYRHIPSMFWEPEVKPWWATCLLKL